MNRRANLTPEQLERHRRIEREAKRRERARFYAAGLNCFGRPATKGPGANRQQDVHPRGCLCHDCLWPTLPYRPAVVRFVR